MAAAGFNLFAGKRVFFFAFGVEKHRKVFADADKAAGKHFFGRGAGDDIVVVLRLPAAQPVAYAAADLIDFHAFSPNSSFCR